MAVDHGESCSVPQTQCHDGLHTSCHLQVQVKMNVTSIVTSGSFQSHNFITFNLRGAKKFPSIGKVAQFTDEIISCPKVLA